MAFSTIDSPKKYFEAKTYTGTGSTQSITGLSFSPDFVWTKTRSTTFAHGLWDSVRGATKKLSSNSTDAEVTESGLTAFNSDGFTLGSDAGANQNTGSYVSWNWLGANSTTTNTSGTITSTVSANTTSGFSIVTRTGTGSVGTVGHGLSAVPSMIITKKRSAVDNWGVYHKSLGATKYLCLNLTDASGTSSSPFNNTEPTSSVFTVGTGSTWNASSATFVDYCFAEVKGFSRFGSYTGNGSADGTFVYTGFTPAFIMFKLTTTIAEGLKNWLIFDNKRDTTNANSAILQPNVSSAEATSDFLDFTSNGFKLRTTDGAINYSGATYIYMAFAENPFCTSKGIPVTAR